MEMKQIREFRIEIYGRVQGVNFRSMTKIFADSIDIKGMVTNREDGGVLIIAQGSEERLNILKNWVRKSPGLSRVDEIKESWQECRKKYNDFKVVKENNLLTDQRKAIKNLGRRKGPCNFVRDRSE